MKQTMRATFDAFVAEFLLGSVWSNVSTYDDPERNQFHCVLSLDKESLVGALNPADVVQGLFPRHPDLVLARMREERARPRTRFRPGRTRTRYQLGGRHFRDRMSPENWAELIQSLPTGEIQEGRSPTSVKDVNSRAEDDS